MLELLILLLTGIGVAAGAFYLGWRACERSITRGMLNAISQLIVELRIERINDNYLLYRVAGDEFVCQAPTLDEIATNFAKNIGENYIGIFNYNDQEVYIVDGKIQYNVTIEE